jgi:hypothetical protein
VKVRITKAQAIEAIRTEPLLAPGRWIKRNLYASSTLQTGVTEPARLLLGDETFCQVCAVGAVLRDVLDPRQGMNALHDVASHATDGDINNVAAASPEPIHDRVRTMVARGKVWNALSVLFEGHAALAQLHFDGENPPAALEKLKADVCSFVDAEFPEDWTIDTLDVPVQPHVKEVT